MAHDDPDDPDDRDDAPTVDHEAILESLQDAIARGRKIGRAHV